MAIMQQSDAAEITILAANLGDVRRARRRDRRRQRRSAQTRKTSSEAHQPAQRTARPLCASFGRTCACSTRCLTLKATRR